MLQDDFVRKDASVMVEGERRKERPEQRWIDGSLKLACDDLRGPS